MIAAYSMCCIINGSSNRERGSCSNLAPVENIAPGAKQVPMKKVLTVTPGAKKAPVESVDTSAKGASVETVVLVVR